MHRQGHACISGGVGVPRPTRRCLLSNSVLIRLKTVDYYVRSGSSMGAFLRSANYTLFIPETPLKPTHPPTYRRMHDQFKTAWGADFRTLGPAASIRPKKIPGVPAGAVGCRPWDPWLPVVENSQLFAQHGHSAGTAHGAPPIWGSLSNSSSISGLLATSSLAVLGVLLHGKRMVQHLSDVSGYFTR